MSSFPTPGSADSLFQHRAYVAFWCARTASSFGFQMLSVAVGWQIYAMTGRAFDLGLIGLVQFFPSVLLALPAGHLADQFDRPDRGMDGHRAARHVDLAARDQ
jgi:MFS family permease